MNAAAEAPAAGGRNTTTYGILAVQGRQLSSPDEVTAEMLRNPFDRQVLVLAGQPDIQPAAALFEPISRAFFVGNPLQQRASFMSSAKNPAC